MIPEPPSDLSSGPIELIFVKIVDAGPGGVFVPFYHFKISTKDGTIAGHLNFKVGDTRHIRECAGHIGYEVLPAHRGNNYAYFACDAIRPFVRNFYTRVILTCDPNNVPSIKVIEKLKARFLNEIVVPPNDPSYKEGSRRKKRYEWVP